MTTVYDAGSSIFHVRYVHASIKSPCAYGKSGKIGGTGTKGPVLNFVYLLIIPSSISLFIICTSFSHIKFKIFSLLDRISTLWTFILYCLMPSTTYTELSVYILPPLLRCTKTEHKETILNELRNGNKIFGYAYRRAETIYNFREALLIDKYFMENIKFYINIRYPY